MKNKLKSNLHLKDVFNLFSGTVIFAVVSVVSNIILSRNLKTNDFGGFNAINSTITLFSPFILFGLNITAGRILAKYKNLKPYFVFSIKKQIEKIYFIFFKIYASIYLVIIPIINIYVLKDTRLILPSYIGFFYLFSLSYSELQIGFINGLGEFKIIRDFSFAKAGLTIILTIVSFFIKDLIFVYALFVILNLVYTSFIRNRLKGLFINNKFGEQVEIPDRFKKKILSYSGVIFLGSVIVLPFSYISNLVVSTNLGIKTFAALSVFTTWQGVLTFFPATYAKIVLPFISGSQFKSTRNSNFYLSTRINNYSVFGIYLFIVSASGIILNLYGPFYLSLQKSFNFFLGSTAVAFMGNTYGTQVQVRGFKYTIILGNAVTGISLIIFTFLFNTNMGINSLCLGMLIGNILNFSISFFTILRRDDFSINFHKGTFLAFIIVISATVFNSIYIGHFQFLNLIFILFYFLIDRYFLQKIV